MYHRESCHKKLSDSNYPQKPNYKENIQQDKKQNLRHFQKSQKTNPLDHSGKPSRHSICESIFHWAGNCPRAFKNMTGQQNQNIGGQKNTNGNDTEINLFTKAAFR